MYCTVEDLRDEGISVETVSDERLAKIIASACEKIDMWTQSFFEPREGNVKVRGCRGATISLPSRILNISKIGVHSWFIDHSLVEIERNGYALYNLNGWGDSDIFVTIDGVFGYEPTPAMIREAAIRLVVRDMGLMGDTAAQAERNAGAVISESTDGHSYTLAEPANKGVAGWSGDGSIDALLLPFRTPIFIGVA